jgi:hypothetical protein
VSLAKVDRPRGQVDLQRPSARPDHVAARAARNIRAKRSSPTSRPTRIKMSPIAASTISALGAVLGPSSTVYGTNAEDAAISSAAAKRRSEIVDANRISSSV